MRVLVGGSKDPRPRTVAPLFKEAAGAERDLPADARETAAKALAGGLFRGDPGELLHIVSTAARSRDLVLLGLGDEQAFKLETLRRAAGVLARRAVREGAAELAAPLASPALRRGLEKLGWEPGVRALAEGWLLGGYVYDPMKTVSREKRREVALCLDPAGLPASVRETARRAVALAEVLAEGVNAARDLANMPPNLLYPETLAAEARRLARRSGLRCRVLGKPEIARAGMGAFLGVAQGSDRPPRLVILEHRSREAKAKRLVLIGKAITFDSGGLSIKPAKGMEEMKFDMAGGAAVIGAIRAIARLGLRLDVTALLPASENLISGSALRPGDILRSACGKTIEVVNTDAEGRLVLADALHYARRYRPDAVVDVATLTGACVVALGTQVTGLMSNDPGLARQVLEAAEAAGERLWELPLLEEYQEAVRSRVADLKNSAGRNAGAITAGLFLAQFIEGVPWVHLDIAGTGWTLRDEAYTPLGATGVGVRTLVELARRLAR
jgi:leucyl aminopeptidase